MNMIIDLNRKEIKIEASFLSEIDMGISVGLHIQMILLFLTTI